MKHPPFKSPTEISTIVNLTKSLNALPFIGNSVEENPFGYGKDGRYLVELLRKCGYNLEIHQRGISGSDLILVPFNEPRK